MINAQGYGRAALQAAGETGLPVWPGVSPFRLEDGTLVGLSLHRTDRGLRRDRRLAAAELGL
jgi:hypothetical protein